MKPIKYQLKNGMDVLLVESKKNPVVAVQAWVRTGSADETLSEAGISHFIEHLLFKGTDHYGVGEIASTVEGNGGELNAYTSFDQTVFHVTMPSERIETGLDVISQMMGSPLFDEEEIDREREVVIEEIKRGNDSPGRVHSQLMFSSVFDKHTYRRPVIGYDKVIRKVSPKVLKKYFADRYNPKNMFLLICGDFDKKNIKPQVDKYFAKFKVHPLRKTKRPLEKTAKGKTVVKKTDFKENQVSLTWRVPSVKHKDIPALDVLALVLGQGDSSRLSRRMRYEEPLVNSVGASSYSMIDYGIFSVSMSMNFAHLEEAVAAAADEMKKLMEEGPTGEELAKAITALSSDTIYSLETVDGLARSFGSMEFYFRNPLEFQKYLKHVQSLTAKDIQAVAKKYLKPETLVATAIVEEGVDGVKKSLKKFRGDFYGKPKVAKKSSAGKKVKLPQLKIADQAQAPIEIIKLPEGGALILKHQAETPTTSFRMAFGGGLLVEPKGKEGLNELLSRTWSGGSEKYPEDKLNADVEAMAAGFGTFGGRNTVGVNADFITSFDERMWDIAQSVILEPSLPEEVFERERAILQRQIAIRKDHPSYVCMRAFSEKLFGEHPYAKDPGGSEASLKALNIQDVRAQARTLLNRENFMMAVVGDFKKDVWIERARAISKALPAGSKQLRKIDHPALKEDVRISQKMDKEQTHLLVGMRGISLDDPKKWTLHVLQSILAGQGGRLFLELRDKESLAYSVSPTSMEGYGTGSFGIYIACSPEKTEKAERMIHAELDKLCNKLVPADELERAINYLCGRTLIDLQRKTAQASSILFDTLYGNDPEEGLLPNERYRAVTAQDVMALAKALFGQKKITSIVGK